VVHDHWSKQGEDTLRPAKGGGVYVWVNRCQRRRHSELTAHEGACQSIVNRRIKQCFILFISVVSPLYKARYQVVEAQSRENSTACRAIPPASILAVKPILSTAFQASLVMLSGPLAQTATPPPEFFHSCISSPCLDSLPFHRGD
jgi:hypothetical protein